MVAREDTHDQQATQFCRTPYSEGTPAPELVASGEVPLYKPGKLRRLRRADVERWLEERTYSPGELQR